MPQISIRERFFPFSHTPGVSLLFPGSSLALEIFPTKIFFKGLLGEANGEIDLPLEGPVSDFTVVQDLERGLILIFGKDKKGFFRFKCIEEGGQLALVQEKGGSAKWPLLQPKVLGKRPGADQRLSVVSLQKRSWERFVEKGDWVALLGTLYRLLVWYEPAPKPLEGDLKELMMGGFEGLLLPTGKDAKKIGYSFSFSNPIDFLRGLRTKIEALFIEGEGDLIKLCPNLPHEIPAGRIKGLIQNGLRFDIEWRKKLVRRVSLVSEKEKTLSLQAKGLSSVRFNGKNVDLSRPISLPAEQKFFLDKFLKAELVGKSPD